MRLRADNTHLFSTEDTMIPRQDQDYITEKIGKMPRYRFRAFSGFGHFITDNPKPVRDAVFAYL
jgi:hypothetical protein